MERVRDAVWRGAENEESSERRRRGRVKGGRELGRPEFPFLFALQIKILFSLSG